MLAPQPTWSAIQITNTARGFLRIDVETGAAAAWIEREAPKYGHLYYPTTGLPYYLLRVADSYDVDGVRRYLEGA